ncbi:Glutamine cyclotransferase [Pedobacter cryoconitis]|uniref:Glutamine cyclotransferase n=1 Tax=Pedobacter cryoconitis TaxID=188932 RepID=A0A127VHL6_9SPHI|nr:glutaminyl-peptide cyclotransferase [Pedobacter cryoconitis]AMQ00711.1 Glutamine cyclotransferase [Pedobacter cryoconitis]
MHFGQTNTLVKLPKLILLIGALTGITFVISCKSGAGASDALSFKLPEQGQSYGLGEDVKVQLDVPAEGKVSSVNYLLDGKPVGSKNNGEALTIKTGDLSLGYKLITAVVDQGSKKDTLTINIVLKSSVKPAEFTYKVINTFPHDTSSYTQGLEYHNGRLLESSGEYGFSTLKWVDLQTGKASPKIELEKKFFGEGSTLIGDKIILLTWKEDVGFIYDAKSLKQLGTFPYQNSREGWGLTFDGQRIIKSDGTNRIWFLNKDNYKEENYVDVYDNNGEVAQLNELEYIDGKIYANIYQTDKIAVIDPKSGSVLSYIDLTGLLPAKDRFPNTDVLNGIAWDAAGKRLFVTGKKFSKLFQIQLVPVTPK